MNSTKEPLKKKIKTEHNSSPPTAQIQPQSSMVFQPNLFSHSGQTSSMFSGTGSFGGQNLFGNKQSQQSSSSSFLFKPIDTSASSKQVNTIQQTQQLPQVQGPPRVKFRLDENGKVQYAAKEKNPFQSYMEMSPGEFKTFKGGGKRWGSNKVTDLETMTNYAQNKTTGKYYEFDKSKAGGFGKEIVDSQHIQRLKSKEGTDWLLDRSRTDRRKETLLPYDVGHYKAKPGNSKMDVLTGMKEASPFKTSNRDHIPSGESLNQRNGGGKETRAYKEGLTIAIPNDTMHKTFSPTFGGRQTTKDKVGSVTDTRKKMDTKYPALAAHRDIETMLSRSENKKLGDHSLLDLSKTQSRQTQIGAYRTLYKQNVKMNASDSTRGVNPKDQAFDFVGASNKKGSIGSFTSTKGTGNQGQKIATMFTGHLAKTIK